MASPKVQPEPKKTSMLNSLLTEMFFQVVTGQKRKERDEEAVANAKPTKAAKIQKHKKRDEEAINDQKQKKRNEESLAKIHNLYGVRREVASCLLSRELFAFSLTSKRVRGLIDKNLYRLTGKCSGSVARGDMHTNKPYRCGQCDTVICSRCYEWSQSVIEGLFQISYRHLCARCSVKLFQS
ncbi:hypothetical protein MBLNU457_5466t1 [Dothideomycetes sp. NU457]